MDSEQQKLVAQEHQGQQKLQKAVDIQNEENQHKNSDANKKPQIHTSQKNDASQIVIKKQNGQQDKENKDHHTVIKQQTAYKEQSLTQDATKTDTQAVQTHVNMNVNTQKQVEQLKQQNEILQRPISINLSKDTFLIKQEDKETIPAQLQDPEVKIQIKQTVQKGHALNKTIFYRIVGFDRHGSIDVLRKISEFESLRKILLQRWPGCFVTQISQKSQMKSQQLRDLHKKRNLQLFLRKLSYCEEVYYKEEIQLFLRCLGIDIEEMFTQMPTLRAKDVIERFKGCFGEITEKPIQPENASSISKFSTSLKKIVNSLKNVSKRALKLAQSYQTYQQAMPQFAKFLIHYEQSCLSEYTTDPHNAVAIRDSEGKLSKLQIINQKQNIFNQLYFMLESQGRDAQALSDIILAMEMFNLKRDELEQQIKQTRNQIDQISLGQKTMKMMTSRKTKQEVQTELQMKEKQLIEEKHVVMQLFRIAEIVLANITIPIFKRIKMNAYYSIIKRWMSIVGEINLEVYQVWKHLSEESQVLLRKERKN